MQRPESIASLRHVALTVRDLEACEAFYTRILGMAVEWRPDGDNVYSTNVTFNLTVTDEVDSILNCNLTLQSIVEEENECKSKSAR